MIKYAPDKRGKLHFIDEVVSGLKCGCFCPECKEPLIAKNQGKIIEHHFAHKNGIECERVHETILHLMAKEVVTENKCIALPTYKSIFYPKVMCFDEVRLEERFAGNYIADIVGIRNKSRLYIEIKVSHAVEDEKYKAIKKTGLSCIEYDLSNIPQNITKEELKNLLCSLPIKVDAKWLHAPKLDIKIEEVANKMEKEARELEEKRQQIIESLEANGDHVLPWRKCSACNMHHDLIDCLLKNQYRVDKEDNIHRRYSFKVKCKWWKKREYLPGDEYGDNHIICSCPYDPHSALFVYSEHSDQAKTHVWVSKSVPADSIKFLRNYPDETMIDLYELEELHR